MRLQKDSVAPIIAPAFTSWPTSRRRASADARWRPTTISSRRNRTWSSRRPPCSSRASSRLAASGWTAGNRGAGARRDTTGASSSSACAAGSAASTSTPASSPATTRRIARSRPGHARGRVSKAACAARRHAVDDDPAEVGAARRRHNFFEFERPTSRPVDARALNIFPDGGVARLRVYGDVVVDWTRSRASRRAVDLAAITNGGLVLGASDMHFGAKDNMIMPGRAANMGDGWETRRRRGPGYDWAIVRLGAAGLVTAGRDRHQPLQGQLSRQRVDRRLPVAPAAASTTLGSADWHEILPQTKLEAHHRHFFTRELQPHGPGFARPAQHLPGRRRQPPACPWNAGACLISPRPTTRGRCCATCCGSTRWIERMLARRPFGRTARRCSTRRATSGSR